MLGWLVGWLTPLLYAFDDEDDEGVDERNVGEVANDLIGKNLMIDLCRADDLLDMATISVIFPWPMMLRINRGCLHG